jgi:menaquinone-dependent protoporphyrinogen oxidase
MPETGRVPLEFPATVPGGEEKANQRVANILLLYSTVYGHTVKISEFIQADAAARGDTVTIRPLDQGAADGDQFDAIVIGASIRHGKHNPAVSEFARANLALLQRKPSAFFSVSLIARKPTRNTPESNQYVREFLRKTPWQPRTVGVFGGVLDYQRYGWFDRAAIRFIMKITKGPTDVHTNVEFTDWDAVRQFAARVAALARGQGPSA